MPDSYLDEIANLIRERIDPAVLPADSEALIRTYAVLALGPGEAVTDRDVHNAWVAWMLAVDPNHPSLVPFDELDNETASSDRAFRDAIRGAASEIADAVDKALLPRGELAEKDQREFFELYMLMVSSSEALVNRRQAVNTFFLTINGVLLSAIGLLLRGAGRANLKAAAILALTVAGIALAYTWWSVLISFGQLNTGKFAIINRMERWLAASIYEAEWVALGRGQNPKVYKSFTSREAIVPKVAIITYAAATVVAGLVALKIWKL